MRHLHDEVSEAQDGDDDDLMYEQPRHSCFCKSLCCNRVYAEDQYEPSQTLERSMSLSSHTLQKVQDAVDGKISASKAKLHRYLTTPNLGPRKKFAPFSIWNFPLALFNDYGVGTKLYFEFLVRLSALSFIFTLLFAPVYYILFSANALSDTSSFEQLSLGNLGDFNASSTTANEETLPVNVPLVDISMTYRMANQYIAYTDFVCILMLLVFVLWFESTLRLKEKEYDDMTKTVGDYSIEVQNLPLNQTSRMKIAKFFAKGWGNIMDVSLCYNDGHIVKMYKQHSKIINDFTKSKVMYAKATKASTRAKETRHLQRLQTKLDKSTLSMVQESLTFSSNGRFCVKAYVTFQHEPERNKMLREYYAQSNRWRYACSSNPRFVYEDRELCIIPAPEPSNILFLNHGYSKWQLFFRRALTTVLSTLIIIGSIALIFGAQFAADLYKLDTSECDDTVTYDASSNVTCYCVQIGTQSAMTDSLCSAYFRLFVQSSVLKLLSSVIIVIVNLILSLVIYTLVEKEKHCTASGHQSALANKIFLSQFMNTALIILVINCDLSTLGIGLGNLFSASYSIQFTQAWCQEIGNSIVLTMVLGSLNPHLVPVLMMGIEKKKRKKAIHSVSTQQELNDKYAGKQFTLADRFGTVSAKICVILMYTPLLPILWFILLVTCAATYWFNKVFFLRIASIPPRYNTELARAAVIFVKIGISLHLLMAIWVFGSPYRNPTVLDYNTYIPITKSYSEYDFVFGVLFNMNSVPFLVLFCTLHLVNVGGCVWRFFCCASARKFEDEAGLLPFADEYVRSENMELYQICTQPTLKDAFGPDLLPVEEMLNKKTLEAAKLKYKKQIAKEMVEELMNVDMDDDEHMNCNGSGKHMKRDSTKYALQISPEFWSIREVGIWLERIKCGKQYMYQFMFKKVSGQRLLNLTDRFLEETIQIENLVHRSQILRAVRKLRIKAGIDAPLKKKPLTLEQRKELEMQELQEYQRHLQMTDQYTEFAKDYKREIGTLV